jgi:hypothetical protein
MRPYTQFWRMAASSCPFAAAVYIYIYICMYVLLVAQGLQLKTSYTSSLRPAYIYIYIYVYMSPGRSLASLRVASSKKELKQRKRPN